MFILYCRTNPIVLKMWTSTTVGVWILLSVVCSFTLVPGEPIHKVENETFSQMMLRLAHMIEDDPQLRADWDARVEAQRDLTFPPLIFDCQVETSDEVPTSVHKLRPSDIKVIGAFGDSISAGNGIGATTPAEVGTENRGEVFTVGGDETIEKGVITITNFLQRFNPNLNGYSSCVSNRDHPRSWFNVAVPGGTNRNMPSQAVDIYERMRNDSRIDFQNDWKLVSLFVGGNDLCASCRLPLLYSPEAYGASFRQAVNTLHANVPRILVQLIVMFDVTPLTNLSTSTLCDVLQGSICSCAINATTRPALKATQLAYYDELKAIADDVMYQDREDFAVVLQPHMRDMIPPIDPETGKYLDGFLAPDCFHPNRLAHQTLAYFLWNTMLTPVGQKPLEVDTNPSQEPLITLCPTPEHPYIFTNLNSDVEWP